MGNIFNKAKKGISNVKKFANKVAKAVKFFLTPIGHFVGILILVVFLIIVIYVISETVNHAIGMWFNDNYAGIATTGDYETVIGGIGYAGYDSLITEEKVQEYAAYEYAVLMDVAEHIYENQDYVTKITDSASGLTYETSAVFPEGVSVAQYNADLVTKEQWQQNLAEAQDGNPLNITKKEGESTKYNIGGNSDVVTPRLIYEIANHEYEEDTVSLMPYLVVVREDIKLNYYLQGLNEGALDKYQNLQKIESGDLAAASSNIEPVRFSVELNKYNVNMPNSAYKEDLKEEHKNGSEDKEVFVKADKEDVGYGSDIYYTEDETNVVYKIPLKLLIGRYLPKSTLLTTWYMLKDSSDYDIDGLMDTIKGVYNAACYNDGLDKIKPITVTGKLDENGEVQPINKTFQIRTGVESTDNATITNAVLFENGNLAKDESGDVKKGTKNIEYATTNKRTFIYFEQYGLETSRYEEYKAYKASPGDEANPNPKSPVVTYLTKERASFIQTLNLSLEGIVYKDESGQEQTTTKTVSLKPTYSFLEDDDLDEKLKSKCLYGEEIPITQEKPVYSFMTKVVERAEEIFNEKGYNKRVYKEESNSDDGAMIYDHYVINKLYIKAELGNENKEGLYRLPEDFSYYNQDNQMPHWYDLKEYGESQRELESAYIEAFREIYSNPYYKNEIIEMLRAETNLEVEDYDENGASYSSGQNIDYYKLAIYTIEEKTLQMRQTIHHRRMPVLLVKYCDMWAKSVEYNNKVTQNPLNYRNYKYLIPNSVSSLGFVNMDLKENAKYRTESFKKYFNSSNGSGDEGIKEGDVLDMLIQWEEYANKGGDESAYAYMRELFKLACYIRDFEDTMYKTAYSYLYIPSTISNFKDETVQKIFWLERLGVSGKDDELTEEEQSKMRTKAIDTKWQNLEYDEYYECIHKVKGEEEANIYALFPFGAPIVRSYYMLKNWETIVPYGYSDSHKALDMYSREHAKAILAAKGSMTTSTPEGQLYFYELNRLTLKYMQIGNTKEDALLLAEKTLDAQLKEYSINSPIVAIAPGTVIRADYDSRSGFYVVIQHDSEGSASAQITSLYAHMKRWPLVEVGETVGAGTILGYEGTTGRSTGNHLHFEISINGNKVNPKDYIMPVFSPFYYDIKAEAVLEKNSEMALGNEYYNLERTILTENALFNNNIVINGMKLSNGKVVQVNKITERTKFYSSKDIYNSGDNGRNINASPYDVIWGNNVPSKELASSMDYIIDLNLLNQSIQFRSGDNDKGSDAVDEINYEKDVTAYPVFFTADEEDLNKKYEDSKIEKADTYIDGEHRRLEWPKWFAEEIPEYKSELVIQYYEGPRNKYQEISSEKALNDLKKIQESLKKAGYYRKAGVNFDVCYGEYSEEFENVVKVMQQDLIKKGYEIYNVEVNGCLDEATVSAYNTMLQYTTVQK